MVSIAMAVFNGERHLREQVDSILHQTIPALEIVVCDDSSTDGTWSILLQYAKEDSRFRIYRNDTNLGFVKNFEKAISLCSGEYIALSDQDDIWTEDHLDLLLKSIGNKILSCGNALLVNENGQSLGITLKEIEQLDYIPEDDFSKLYSIMLFRNPYQGSSMLFKSELIQKALPFPHGTSFHDRWLAMVACLTGGINYVDSIVLYYRRTHENITEYIKKRSRFKYCLHGWTNGQAEEIDQLLEQPNVPISKANKYVLLKWRKLLAQNTKIRKPITVSYFISNFRKIYSL